MTAESTAPARFPWVLLSVAIVWSLLVAGFFAWLTLAPPAADPALDDSVRLAPTQENAAPTSPAPDPLSPPGASAVAPEKAPLPKADPSLLEDSDAGPVPRIGSDGRLPWRVFARSTDVGADRPWLAVIVSGLGLSGPADAALGGLPPTVTAGLLPFAPNADAQAEALRSAGHELVIAQPMQPSGFPASDPGPGALLIDRTSTENREALMASLAAAPGAIGITGWMGDRFLADATPLSAVLAELQRRGLAFIDPAAGLGGAAAEIAETLRLPHVTVSRRIEADFDAARITAQLDDGVALAREVGWAVVMIAEPTPLALETLDRWLESGGLAEAALVPASAVIARARGEAAP